MSVKVTITGMEVLKEDFPVVTDEEVQAVTFMTLLGVRDYWMQQAQSRLHGNNVTEYLAGIGDVVEAGNTYEVALTGKEALRIEEGFLSYDMRSTLLGDTVPVVGPGEKGKMMTKDGGFYRHIPFRHGTPTSKGNAGAPMGSRFKSADPAAALALGKKLHKVAKERRVGSGETMTMATMLPNASKAFLNAVGKGNKKDIYEGLHKRGAAGKGHYMTFRAISTSSPNGWIHPGVTGARLADAVHRYANRLLSDNIEAFLKGKGL